jgi:hypothetical protein
MPLPVTPNQFELRQNRLIHVPTGAQFLLGESYIVIAEWGDAGQSHSHSGSYDPAEVKGVACEILENERTTCL